MVRLEMPLVDDHLEFLKGRCRPNAVLAAACDLKVFFTVVGKTPAEVEPRDVPGFITTQGTGRPDGHRLQPVGQGEPSARVSVSTMGVAPGGEKHRRRLRCGRNSGRI